MDGKIQSGHEEKIDLNQMPVGVILTDESGILYGWNRHADKMADGQCREGSRLTDLFDIHPPRCMIHGRVYHVTAAPFEHDDFHGAIYVFQDLEDILREESETKAREALEMIAEIAHEIRNPLGSIELFASLLRKTAKGERELNGIQQIILSVKTINERISELLRVHKKQAFRRQPLSLNRLIHDFFIIPGKTASFLKIHYAEGDLPIEGDEKMLRQMFLNVLIQILQIMPSQAGLTVETFCQFQGPASFAGVTFICEGEGAIFKNFDLALGLNLAIIHNIAQMHSGIVNIGSNALSILLPVKES